jgi:hypothetical protein
VTKHHCHAIGCATAVPTSTFMCRTHWALVPTPLRLAIVRNYRRGQCVDKRPSRAWLAAATRARAHVARAEGRASAAALLERLADVADRPAVAS